MSANSYTGSSAADTPGLGPLDHDSAVAILNGANNITALMGVQALLMSTRIQLSGEKSSHGMDASAIAGWDPIECRNPL
jgi:hypothetical protein